MISENEEAGESPINVTVDGQTVEAALISPPAQSDKKPEVKPLEPRVTIQAASNGRSVQGEIISPSDELASREAAKAKYIPSSETTVSPATKKAEKMGIRIVKPGNK